MSSSIFQFRRPKFIGCFRPWPALLMGYRPAEVIHYPRPGLDGVDYANQAPACQSGCCTGSSGRRTRVVVSLPTVSVSLKCRWKWNNFTIYRIKVIETPAGWLCWALLGFVKLFVHTLIAISANYDAQCNGMAIQSGAGDRVLFLVQRRFPPPLPALHLLGKSIMADWWLALMPPVLIALSGRKTCVNCFQNCTVDW